MNDYTKLIERLRVAVDVFEAKGCVLEISAETCTEIADALEKLVKERDAIIYALDSIVWYNGHGEWLMSIAEKLKSAGEEIMSCPLPTIEWGTEEHTLWEVLAGMFGSWGTSIRTGWIEETKDAADFIENCLCKTYLDDEEKL